ncbi:MAG: gamma carbonic anhydrase family protein [Acetobacteraceae bacterium]
MLFELDGVAPRLAEGAWVAPTAVVIGDVWLGERSTIWFNCLLRGDTNRIRIGARTNIQDGSVLHVNPGEEWVCEIGDDVTVGHAAIVHACKLENFAFVGMGATVLDGAVIEAGAMLAAGGLLTPGKRIPRRELWGGRPARKMRDLPDEERTMMDHIAVHYAALGQRYRAGLKQVG